MTDQNTGFAYRFLWTWDYRMDWAVGEKGAGSTLGGNRQSTDISPYMKSSLAFIKDYQNLIDFMAKNELNGIVVWGLLRDVHGGVKAANEICSYAHARGVKIMAGVGTSWYGGAYYEGEHEFNVHHYLKKNPARRSLTKDGQWRWGACPTNPENLNWLQNGIRWLIDNVSVDGFELESGDRQVCYCDGCRERIGGFEYSRNDYFKTIAINYKAAIEAIAETDRNKLHLSYAPYCGFDLEMLKHTPAFIESLPAESVCDWTITDMLECKQPGNLASPAVNARGYLHYQSKCQKDQDDFLFGRLAHAASSAKKWGLQGLCMYGEEPDSRANTRINYAVYSYFLKHPDKTLDDFATEQLPNFTPQGMNVKDYWNKIKAQEPTVKKHY